MPTLTIDHIPIEVPQGKRLTNALIDEGKIDQLHACGGNAKCTTCRVQFIAGEPTQMTQAERDVLTVKGLLSQKGLRLSCQIICDHDMSVQIISRFANSGRKDPGSPLADTIQPPPVWTTHAPG